MIRETIDQLILDHPVGFIIDSVTLSPEDYLDLILELSYDPIEFPMSIKYQNVEIRGSQDVRGYNVSYSKELQDTPKQVREGN